MCSSNNPIFWRHLPWKNFPNGKFFKNIWRRDRDLPLSCVVPIASDTRTREYGSHHRCSHTFSSLSKILCSKKPSHEDFFKNIWRRDRDSNSGYLAARQFSRLLQSTTLPSLRMCGRGSIGKWIYLSKSFSRIASRIVARLSWSWNLRIVSAMITHSGSHRSL